ANQTIRRLERLELESEAERRARAEDLNVLVDLVVEAWRALDRRLDRLEGTVQRLERALVQAPAAELHGLHARRSSA
ncbi:MAG: hypothetical protein ICV74_05050, partial [Thermoleophilia bacterium]|nr:hypothetical protein [Thermoleophilia bacterium]